MKNPSHLKNEEQTL